MHDEPHVGFVDAHAERIGRHHDAHLTAEPILLPRRTLGMTQTAVVGRRRNTGITQRRGQLLGALARPHVDDTRTGDVLQ